MTSLARVNATNERLHSLYLQVLRDADFHRETEYRAVVRIQAWIRGTVTRNRLDKLNRASLRIQRAFRGQQDRKYVAALRTAREHSLQDLYFYVAATTIQKRWRGYFSRACVHDFRARKAYLSAVADKNAEIRRLGAAEAYTAALRAAEAAETRQTAELQRNLRRMHHLVSTASQPGILNNPYHKSLGLTQTVRGKPLEEALRESVRETTSSLPPLKLRPEVVRPDTFRQLPRQQGQGATIRTSENYARNHEVARLEVAIDQAHMLANHDRPFAHALRKPEPYDRSESTLSLKNQMPYDPENVGLKSRNDKWTEKAREISQGKKWSSATHAIGIFDHTII